MQDLAPPRRRDQRRPEGAEAHILAEVETLYRNAGLAHHPAASVVDMFASDLLRAYHWPGECGADMTHRLYQTPIVY